MGEKKSIEFIYCYCGCRKTTWKYDSRGRERHYIKGHAWIGRKHSDESKKKIGQSSKGRERTPDSIIKQIESHKGYRHSEETKQKISKSHFGKTLTKETLEKITGKNNHNWTGDNVGYGSLHDWVRRYFPKPEKCHMCKEKPPKDLANISGVYNREFKNWAYFCARCHHLFDNIYERQKITKRLKKSVTN